MVAKAVIRIDVNTTPIDGTCPDCGFDALLQVTGYHLCEHGVTTMLQKVTCGRCAAERSR